MRKTIGALRALATDTGAELYVTGGFVRDLLRKKRNKDLDIVMRNLSLHEATSFLAGYGNVKTVFISNPHDKFSLPILTFKVQDEDIFVQITLPRCGGNKTDQTAQLSQDAKYRDFTLNAMYLPIDNINPNKVIDFFGGKNSIRKRRIDAVGRPEDRLRESPVRIMRAFSLSSRMDYQIGDELLKAIRDLRDLLVLVPPENIRDELNEILLSPKPSKYLRAMLQTGVLAIVMPELYKCVGVIQDSRHHKFDVFTHCITTCDFIEPNLVLRIAALMHDVGKPDTRAENDDGNGKSTRITFHNHELFSVKRTQEFMERLRYDKKTISEVINLVRYHMYHYTSEWSDAAIRRFITKVGINNRNVDNLYELPLFKIRAAERLGNGFKKIAVTDRQLDFQKKIVQIFKGSNGLTISDLDINGNVIMEIFKLKPSHKIGEILNFLLEKVLEKPVLNNRMELIKLTAECLCKDIHTNEEWTRTP